ncbi:hypothetical protein Nepgr_010003 [Nepenthes gracilis]|uniref:DUF7780 domain-containing protein n=1 Tax=Nepenthes gracilis TaxID=150966 RepID=A0AAD3SBI0_NEPGR|nr:hypothetical protein Nepgr_010003 [Nepenthes gracilis]
MVSPAKSKSSSQLGWGMGFLLIFFPEDDSGKKKTLYSLSSSSSTAAAAKSSRFTASSPLLAKIYYTLSICALLVFTTLLLFTFEPTYPHHHHTSRRHLLIKPRINPPNPQFSLSEIPTIFNRNSLKGGASATASATTALQGMGTLYRRGTKAMRDLIVGHVPEDVEVREFRSFLRILHYVGLPSRTDLVLIFPSPSSSLLSRVVEEENESFLKLVNLYAESNGTILDSAGHNELIRYLRIGTEKEEKIKKETATLWGKGTRNNYSDSGQSDHLSYGSIVGFEASELDPENSLAGFLDNVPLCLRRWACYPMLLGRIKRNFKHMMLVDVKDLLILKDPFAKVRNRSPESLLLWTYQENESGKRGRRNSAKTHQKPVSPAIIAGGGRGVRRFSTAMLTEIVRATIEHKGKGRNSVTELGLVNQLVHSFYALKDVNLISPAESLQHAGSLAESGHPLSSSNYSYHTAVQRGHKSFDIDFAVMTELCSSGFYSSIYRDCLAIQ